MEAALAEPDRLRLHVRNPAPLGACPMVRPNLLVDLAQPLLQLGGQRFKPLARHVVRLAGKLPGLQDFHFQFDAFIL
jgi:hypothetical protein